MLEDLLLEAYFYSHCPERPVLSQKHLESLPPMDPGGCSVMFTPTNAGNVLGQTWDMHGSAQDHVIVIELPDGIFFSIAGCLGMTGLNKHGVGMTINNLNSIDAKSWKKLCIFNAIE